MNSLFDKWNLRPQERRLVVVVGLVFFVVLNLWFIWPHFGEWKTVTEKTARARETAARYQKEIDRVPSYQARLQELQSAGTAVASEEQALQLQRTVETRARANQVHVTRTDPIRARAIGSGAKTNQFFEEQALTIHATTGNKELVNFLVSLASDEAIVRIKDLDLKPTPDQTRLNAIVTFVASYQKSTQPRQTSPRSTPVTAQRTP
jgi:Tfp pilus assembly protein PilO